MDIPRHQINWPNHKALALRLSREAGVRPEFYALVYSFLKFKEDDLAMKATLAKLYETTGRGYFF